MFFSHQYRERAAGEENRGESIRTRSSMIAVRTRIRLCDIDLLTIPPNYFNQWESCLAMRHTTKAGSENTWPNSSKKHAQAKRLTAITRAARNQMIRKVTRFHSSAF